MKLKDGEEMVVQDGISMISPSGTVVSAYPSTLGYIVQFDSRKTQMEKFGELGVTGMAEPGRTELSITKETIESLINLMMFLPGGINVKGVGQITAVRKDDSTAILTIESLPDEFVVNQSQQEGE